MKFSVTLPSYKSRYLQEAIESVVSQTYADWELVIVDDCSPEELASIVKPYLNDSRVHYYRNAKNCGAANVVDNWNICLNYCTGDYVICIGDDDRLLPCCLEELSQTISKYPGLNVYHLQTEIIDEKGMRKEVLPERPEKEDVLSAMMGRWKGRKQFIGDFCFSREHLNTCGGYYPLPYAWGSDDITVFRAMLPTGIANTQEPCFQYRENVYSISLSHNHEEKVSAFIMLKQWHQMALNDLLSQGTYSHEAVQEATEAMNRFVKGQTSFQISCDIRQGGMRRFWFWLRNNPKGILSQYDIIKIYIISTIRKS